ncbi:hypothetical protein A2W24_02695 [Microgenomates group bacterium RBG_16_45_19]|nr:MAG: hypothetical protein A2W24_02695 [Microgenomates group bacterium RBG_16_45_19]
MTRMQVYLPDEMFVELKRYARLKDIPMSHVIRKGLSWVLAEKGGKKIKFGEGFFGAYKGPIKTNAVEDIDDYYRNHVV